MWQTQDPRSKIPQDSWEGILDQGSWICDIEIEYGLNISIRPSLNPRFLPGIPRNLGSWILDPPFRNSMCFNIFKVVLCPSWFCYLHGSCDSLHVYICSSLHVHICYMCIAKQLEATASFTLQPFVSQNRYSAWRAVWNNSDVSETLLRFI